jgi:lysophospholipase L1-like esterase
VEKYVNGPRAFNAVVIGLLIAVLLPQPPAGAAPTRVLLVGDSITQGMDGDTAYRCDLWDLLPVGSVDFVGGLSTTGDCALPGFDADHDAVGGATTADRVAGGAWSLSYDVALVHLGTNDKNSVNFDWTQSYIDDTLKPTYRELIDKVRQNNPDVKIYLGQIIPCGFGPDGASGFLGCDVTHNGGIDNFGNPVDGINDAWADVAAEKSTPQSPITLVDHRQGFTLSDLKADEVHPNASGRAKMAAAWAAALQDDLPDLPTDSVLLVEPNGRWHIRRAGQADYTFFYGVPGDVPIFGDWNGDGVATPGAYRVGPGGGFAYLTNTLPPDGGAGIADFSYFFGAKQQACRIAAFK